MLVTPFKCLTGDDANRLMRTQPRQNRLSVYPLSYCASLKIDARAAKCHVLDLFAPLHTGAWRGWSCAETRGGGFTEGSAEETGLCASDNTAAFDGAWPFSVGERNCSASDTSPPWTPLVMIGFSYRTEMVF